MAEEEQVNPEDNERTIGQIFADNWVLLFILSLFLSGLFYNAWGIIELLTLPTR